MNTSRKHIYVAYTGGTIGMRKSEHGYVPVAGFLAQTLAQMPEFHRDEMPLFSVHEYPRLMDSSDMTPDDWNAIAQDIYQHYHQYDGFVVLHGTDTMAYTASALSFMFANLSKPIIVTGSQIPLVELRSDGQVNLLNALYLAANYPINEVTLFFNNQLYRGNRATKADADGFDAFASPNAQPLLRAGIAIERLTDDVQQSQPTETLSLTRIVPQPISVVTLYPGINIDVIRNMLAPPARALIIKSFGVGNAPQRPELLQLLQQACERGVVIVNCSQCFKGRVNMQGYATGQALLDVGVVSGADMTLEATLTKLHYLFSQSLTPEQVRAQMLQSLRGELTI